MNHREGVGKLECRLCGASFQMPIHHLHEPIDVFSEWLDACEATERGNDGNSTEVNNNGDEQNDRGYIHDDNDSDDDSDDDDLGEPSGFTTASGYEDSNDQTNTSRKRMRVESPSKSNLADSDTAENQSAHPQQSYASLGLDDSDDDSD
eukprot:CAMPEP_0184864982 /NCGR_PEP_ID=MMETSP0580-20130426/16546_1 /TAXON_ID=1118495 /ORGANISM="Dactyliosolen fragilissimus" /LENGTH=148 /DNA_ID=CAMNT_0027363967 /DNA_START=206 /DNA_END=652 /DNA_ORIENTATION=-